VTIIATWRVPNRVSKFFLETRGGQTVAPIEGGSEPAPVEAGWIFDQNPELPGVETITVLDDPNKPWRQLAEDVKIAEEVLKACGIAISLATINHQYSWLDGDDLRGKRTLTEEEKRERKLVYGRESERRRAAKGDEDLRRLRETKLALEQNGFEWMCNSLNEVRRFQFRSGESPWPNGSLSLSVNLSLGFSFVIILLCLVRYP
jgi:hypothetical protein